MPGILILKYSLPVIPDMQTAVVISVTVNRCFSVVDSLIHFRIPTAPCPGLGAEWPHSRYLMSYVEAKPEEARSWAELDLSLSPATSCVPWAGDFLLIWEIGMIMCTNIELFKGQWDQLTPCHASLPGAVRGGEVVNQRMG